MPPGRKRRKEPRGDPVSVVALLDRVIDDEDRTKRFIDIADRFIPLIDGVLRVVVVGLTVIGVLGGGLVVIAAERMHSLGPPYAVPAGIAVGGGVLAGLARYLWVKVRKKLTRPASGPPPAGRP